MSVVLLASLAAVAPAWAAEPGDGEAPGLGQGEADRSAAEELEAARRAYAQGQPGKARELLQAILDRGPDIDRQVRHDALADLGDLLYSEGNPSDAEPFFRALLDEDPDYVMDPLRHPAEVTRYFDSLRPRRPLDVVLVPTPSPRAPPPWLALAPGGVYYFAKGEVGPGLAVAGAQAALLVANLALYTEISGMEEIPRGSAEVTQWRNLRLATDLTAGAFYVSLVLPPAIEFGRWGVENPRVGVGIAPGAITVRGTF